MNVGRDPKVGGDSEPQAPVGSRRAFFKWVTVGAAGFIGLGLAIPLLGYVISPALKRRERKWVDVGSVEDLHVDDPKQLDYVTTIQDGYLKSQSQKAVWAVNYRWEGKEKAFHCPCHGSVFDIDGRVQAGPAPRPLDLLPSKIENGRLLVIFKEFKSGIAESVEL